MKRNANLELQEIELLPSRTALNTWLTKGIEAEVNAANLALANHGSIATAAQVITQNVKG